MSGQGVLWRIQTALHGTSNNAALPVALVGAASILVIYRHFIDKQDDDPIKHFCLMIVIQMIPLVFLEMKILATPDPVSMLTRFGVKVLLMHAGFLILRLQATLMLSMELGVVTWHQNLLAFAFSLVALHFGFRFRIWHIGTHLDVVLLLVVAMGGAAVTELLNFNRLNSYAERTVFSASTYMEILAFMPAVWIVFKGIKKNDDEKTEEAPCDAASVQTQAMFFFAFLVPFYVMEDLMSAYRVYYQGDEPMAAIAHIVHFILIADFACFLLSHIFNPDKVQGSFLRWLLPNCDSV